MVKMGDSIKGVRPTKFSNEWRLVTINKISGYFTSNDMIKKLLKI